MRVKMNRRGDIPILMVFLVAIVLIIFTFIGFASFNDKFAEASEGRNRLLESVDFYESYVAGQSEIIGKQAISELVREKYSSSNGCCAEVDSQGRSSCRGAESAVECTLVGNFNPGDDCSDSVCEYVGFNAFLDDSELKKKFVEIAERNNLGIKGTESFFGKVGRGEFELYLTDYGSRYEFSIDDLFVYSSRGANKIERHFDLRIKFDLKGNVVSRSREVGGVFEDEEAGAVSGGEGAGSDEGA